MLYFCQFVAIESTCFVHSKTWNRWTRQSKRCVSVSMALTITWALFGLAASVNALKRFSVSKRPHTEKHSRENGKCSFTKRWHPLSMDETENVHCAHVCVYWKTRLHNESIYGGERIKSIAKCKLKTGENYSETTIVNSINYFLKRTKNAEKNDSENNIFHIVLSFR